MKDFPADKITGFYCQSVSLTEYLVRAGGQLCESDRADSHLGW